MTPQELQEELQHRLQEAAAQSGQRQYVLRLYVAGSTPRSQRAIANLQRICTRYLGDRVDLEVIDIYQQPENTVVKEDLVAVPTLVKALPPPLRRLIGDLSDENRVLLALDLLPLELEMELPG